MTVLIILFTVVIVLLTMDFDKTRYKKSIKNFSDEKLSANKGEKNA